MNLLLLVLGISTARADPVGTRGTVGCPPDAKTISRLEITQPGVYENCRIDGKGAGGNIVKIKADGVTLRNCEIFNATGNGIGVFGSEIVIENCRIHHLLNGSFEEQTDAHGITGRWGNVTIRNCEIYQTSGDCIQFDPDRSASNGTIVVENCHLWTAPLTEDWLGFKRGQRPGENALDTKVRADGERRKLVIRDCYFHGWNQPAQIGNVAALNLKENVDVQVSRCVFSDNEIAFRVRGPGQRGGAHVAIADCAIYGTKVGVRAEDGVEQLTVRGMSWGSGVGARTEFHNGKQGTGVRVEGDREAPQLMELLKSGFPER